MGKAYYLRFFYNADLMSESCCLEKADGGLKKKKVCLASWLMPVIPVTWEVEIRSIKAQDQRK
jgi:hypothetical protein